jgi:hypothetical protein
MKTVVEIYRQNIYGVIGTLAFHILLFGFFLLANVNIKRNITEEQIIIDFPVEMENIKETREDVLSKNNDSPDNLTNLASNRLSSKTQTSTVSNDKFFDNNYQDELNEAQNLVANVNKQLAKEKVKIEDIKMPVQTVEEGKNPDSVKNVIYTGESNIVYYLENRYHTSLPIPIYLTQGGGKIIVDIVVDRAGNVIKATPRNDSKIKDEMTYLYARVAAERTKFNADQSAPAQQKGTIHYNFKSQ